MISRRTTVLNILVLGSVLGAGLPAFGEVRRPSAIQKFDTDNDGTLDLNEVKKAGGALFDKLDRDHDGTLDKRELRGRLSAKEFAAADPDKDGTLTKEEYLAVVEQRFKAADPDNDGTLDAKEADRNDRRPAHRDHGEEGLSGQRSRRIHPLCEGECRKGEPRACRHRFYYTHHLLAASF